MVCLGLPVQAKGINPVTSHPAPAKSSKTEARVVASAASSTTTHPTPVRFPKTEARVVTSATSSTTTHPAPARFPKTEAVVVVSATPSARIQAKPTLIAAKTSDKPLLSTLPTTTKTRTETSASSSSLSDTNGNTAAGERLARVTAYWAGEGDYYTGHGISSTGIHLHDGHCAVDPRIIPYGSVVEIAGVGKYLAVDTGSAVISREAAREAAQTSSERNALVVDLYFESRRDGENFASTAPKYASICWWTPAANDHLAREARSLFADEDWSKIQSKQL